SAATINSFCTDLCTNSSAICTIHRFLTVTTYGPIGAADFWPKNAGDGDTEKQGTFSSHHHSVREGGRSRVRVGGGWSSIWEEEEEE
ncbi:hypothetical protein L195_g046654, partial [Trifolium pratense]